MDNYLILMVNTLQKPNSTAPSYSGRAYTNEKIVYAHPSAMIARVAYFGMFGQLVFWLNLAHFTWTDLRSKDGAIAPPLERFSAATVSVGIGGLIAYLLHFYARRRVSKLTLLPGGRKFEIRTANLLGKNTFTARVTEVACSNMASRSEATQDIAALYNEYKAATSTGSAAHQQLGPRFSKQTPAPSRRTAGGLGSNMVLNVKGYNTGFIVDRSGDFIEPDLWNRFVYKQS